MNRIDTFLSGYNLDLSDCHPDWIDLVEEYNGIKSSLPDAVREQKENAIIAQFNDFHTVEEQQPEKKPLPPKEKKKKEPVSYTHDIDSEGLLSKAEDIANLL